MIDVYYDIIATLSLTSVDDDEDDFDRHAYQSESLTLLSSVVQTIFSKHLKKYINIHYILLPQSIDFLVETV